MYNRDVSIFLKGDNEMNRDEVPGKRTRDKVGYLDEQGRSVNEIAEILGIGPNSVYQHRTMIKKEKEPSDPFTKNEETPFDFPALPTYEEPTPVHKIVEEKAPTFEISLDNMDGATVKALIMIANNKLDNEKTYRISLSIEEK